MLETQIVFVNLENGSPTIYRFWKRRAPGNDEDPLNKILEIMDMRSISIKIMKWKFDF